jgi:thiopurine S-methyltransferase
VDSELDEHAGRRVAADQPRVRYGARVMDAEWLARWREGRIAFHESHPNTFLERYVPRFAGRRRILVPLCGKAEDLAFLAVHGHEVIGVELAEQAVRAFFDEHALAPVVSSSGPFTTYTAGAITVHTGDFFALTRDITGSIDALYDRAALVALPADLRPRYAEQVRALLPAGAPGLVITLEYDPQRMAGPPFPVFESELRSLYPGSTIELLDERPATGGGKCTQSGVPATDRCFTIRFDGSR